MSRDRLERVLVEALRAADPPARLQRAIAEDAELTDAERAWLAAVDADGLRLGALQVARLRWARLLRGAEAVRRWAAQDEATFAVVFRQYHREVPMTATAPEEEAALFLRWVQSDQGTMQ